MLTRRYGSLGFLNNSLLAEQPRSIICPWYLTYLHHGALVTDASLFSSSSSSKPLASSQMSTSEAPAPLSKRSCLPCYQRKLKCDKKKPCTRCATRGERCDYFLGPIRRNRGPKARPNAISEAVGGSLNRLKSVLAIRDGKANTVTIYSADPALLTETDLLVIDGSGKSRLLSAVGWASFMDEVSNSSKI